jgi:serine/threonine protein kinase
VSAYTGFIFFSHIHKIAIKRMPHVTTKQKRKNCQEVRFLLFCRGQSNILQFRQAILDQDRSEIWMASEYLEGGTLTQVFLSITHI